jgi:hypothetical protein
VPRQRRQRGSFDDEDLAEAIERVEYADHDDEPAIKRARDAAREAERDREWD